MRILRTFALQDSQFLSTKNTCIFAYVVGIYLTSSGLNDDVNEVLNKWPVFVSKEHIRCAINLLLT